MGAMTLPRSGKVITPAAQNYFHHCLQLQCKNAHTAQLVAGPGGRVLRAIGMWNLAHLTDGFPVIYNERKKKSIALHRERSHLATNLAERSLLFV
jgi:hypothetical protein